MIMVIISFNIQQVLIKYFQAPGTVPASRNIVIWDYNDENDRVHALMVWTV